MFEQAKDPGEQTRDIPTSRGDRDPSEVGGETAPSPIDDGRAGASSENGERGRTPHIHDEADPEHQVALSRWAGEGGFIPDERTDAVGVGAPGQ